MSDSIETYSPFLDQDLEASPFADLGNLDFSGKSLEGALQCIGARVTTILRMGGLPLCLGGEHTITLPIVEALEQTKHEFMIVHLDAHSDLRDSYEGSRINHATVMTRVMELVGPERLLQIGIRAGTREEFRWMREHDTLMHWGAGADEILLQRVGGAPVYLSLDLDVLDPACFPSTGNPEAGGWFYSDLERFFQVLTRTSLIGADVVELNPSLDTWDMGAITAAKIVRELLLILGSSQTARR